MTDRLRKDYGKMNYFGAALNGSKNFVGIIGELKGGVLQLDMENNRGRTIANNRTIGDRPRFLLKAGYGEANKTQLSGKMVCLSPKPNQECEKFEITCSAGTPFVLPDYSKPFEMAGSSLALTHFNLRNGN